MKLIRHGGVGKERHGVLLEEGTRLDVSGFGSDYNEQFFATDGLRLLKEWLKQNSASAPRVSPDVRLGPPIARPSKIVCIGLNYRDHAAETGAEIPVEPVVFLKTPDTVVGPDDTVLVPRRSTKTDYEVELAVVIGQQARYLDSPEEALGF